MDLLQNNQPGSQVSPLLTADRWSATGLKWYILTMPFVSAFAYSGTISIPLIIAVILFILMGTKILNDQKLPSTFLTFDIILVFAFLFFVSFTFLMNGIGNRKALNHTVGYLSSYLLFYVCISYCLQVVKDWQSLFKNVLKYLTWITIFCAFYGAVEFTLGNVFSININDYIPRPSDLEANYDATVLGLFYRARGFAPESGHYTFMMELFAPLVVYYLYFSGFCKWHFIVKACSILLICLSFVFAVSTASFAVVPVAILIASLFYAKSLLGFLKRNWIRTSIAVIVSLVVILVLNSLIPLYALVVISSTDKLDSGSFDDRQARLDFFSDNFFRLNFDNKIYGAGPAGYDILGFTESNAILSLYYSVTFEVGIIGLLLLLALFVYLVVSCLAIKHKIGYFLLIALLAGIFHYHFIANFWYPWFWFIAVFIMFCKIHFPKDITAVELQPAI